MAAVIDLSVLTQGEHAHAHGGKHRSIRGVRGHERGKSCSLKDLAILSRKRLESDLYEIKSDLWNVL